MNIAFLFNSDHEEYDGFYGIPIMNKILRTNILQNTKRHMRLSIGDVLTYGIVSQSQNRTYAHLEEVCRKVYRPHKYNKLKETELESTFTTATVFCWVFQNMTYEIASNIDVILRDDKTYLGAMDVIFNYGPHLALFRNSLCEEYGLISNKCSIFYHMNDNEDPDISIKNCFEKNGFIVNYEDIGARRTIFDNYDSLEHFKRVEEFKDIFSKLNGLNDEIASDVSFFIEELHPKIFETLASAARVFKNAETEDDFAQVAISGRRFLEKIANYLFPAQKEKWKGRDVGNDKFKNRIWAYIEKTIEENNIKETNKLTELGDEADRLLDLFNKGLHFEIDKFRIENALVDLIIWLSELIKLSTESIKRPYLAYEESLKNFYKNELIQEV